MKLKPTLKSQHQLVRLIDLEGEQGKDAKIFVVQVLKYIQGKMSWINVTEPLTRIQAHEKLEHFEKSYLHNTYRVL